MWILRLNDMRSRKAETLVPVAVSETRQGLFDFVRSERADEPYEDNAWRKGFKKGGPLEWFNNVHCPEDQYVDIGTEEIAVEKARERYRELVSSLRRV